MNVIYSFAKDATFLAAPNTPPDSSPETSQDSSDAVFFVLQARSFEGDDRYQQQLAGNFADLAVLHQGLLNFVHSVCERSRLSQSVSVVDLEADWATTAPLPPASLYSCATATLPLFRVVASGASDAQPQASAGKIHQYFFLYQYLQSHHFPGQPSGASLSTRLFTTWDTFLVASAAATFDGTAASGPCDARLSLRQYVERSQPAAAHGENHQEISLAVWDEETLWRLLNALVSVLAVYHSAGFHFGGRIKWEDIVCFAIPAKLAGQLAEAQRSAFQTSGAAGLPTQHRDPSGSWNVAEAEMFVKTLTSGVVIPQLFIGSRTPSHRSFFILKSLPSSVLSTQMEDSPEQVARYQADDVRCAGRIMLAVAEAHQRANGDARSISSEFIFLVRRMCGGGSSRADDSDGEASAAIPSALHLSQLQALRLRTLAWFYRLLAEENLHYAQMVTQGGESLRPSGQAHPPSLSSLRRERDALDAREQTLLARERKLDAVLDLYELTHERLDALPSTDSAGYAQLRRELAAAKPDSRSAGGLHGQQQSSQKAPAGARGSQPESTTPPHLSSSVPSRYGASAGALAGARSPIQAEPGPSQRPVGTPRGTANAPYTSPFGSAVRERAAPVPERVVGEPTLRQSLPRPSPALTSVWLPAAKATSTPVQPPRTRDRGAGTPPAARAASTSPMHTPITQTSPRPHVARSADRTSPRGAAATTAMAVELSMHTPTRPPREPLGAGGTGGQSQYGAFRSVTRGSSPAAEGTSSAPARRSPRGRGGDDGWAQSQFSALEELRATFDGAVAGRASHSRSGSRAATPRGEEKGSAEAVGVPASARRRGGGSTRAGAGEVSHAPAHAGLHDGGGSPTPGNGSAYVPFFSSLSARQSPRSAPPPRSTASTHPVSPHPSSTSTPAGGRATSARAPLPARRGIQGLPESRGARTGSAAPGTPRRSPFGLGPSTARPRAAAEATPRGVRVDRRDGDGVSGSTALDLLKRLRNGAGLTP